jgi:DNA polymerase-3 subunit delta
MIFKSFSLNFKDLLKKNFILLYGENLSLISELEDKILAEAKASLGLIPKRYQEEYLIQHPELLHQILNSDALFGEQEIIIIGKSSDKILDLLELETAKSSEKKIIFLSDILTKKSQLRTVSENSENFASIACYNDTPEQLQSILAQKLKDNKITVSRELLNSIFEENSLNRQDINDGINKLQLIQKSSVITDSTLKNIFYSSSDNDNFEVINYCLLGDKKNINKVLNNIYAQGISFNEILAVLKYKINKLIDILESNTNHLNISQLVESYKPPIFWKEKNIIKEQLNRWTIKELYQLLDIIFETEINCKKNYEISTTILQQFIITTSTKACLENKFI